MRLSKYEFNKNLLGGIKFLLYIYIYIFFFWEIFSYTYLTQGSDVLAFGQSDPLPTYATHQKLYESIMWCDDT